MQRTLELGLAVWTVPAGLLDTGGLFKVLGKALDQSPVVGDKLDRVGKQWEAGGVRLAHLDVQLGELDQVFTYDILVRGRNA